MTGKQTSEDPSEGKISFKKILVPTDFSACADHAFAYALDLARRHAAAVDLLHVVGPLEGSAYSPLYYSPEAAVRHSTPDTLIYEHLMATIDRHDTAGVRVDPVQRRGTAIAPTILDFAEKEYIDLIVMGTQGRRGMQRFLIGSLVEKIVRWAPCSVLTVREGAQPSSPPQRILVPVDFSAFSEGLLRYAGALAGCYGAGLDLLHVVEPLPSGGAFSGALPALEYTRIMEGRAREHLLDLVGKTNAPAPETRLHVESGHAAAGILDFAERTGVDLIVLATQGRSGIERFLIGSVAERVVRTAPCPVLTVKVTVTPVDAEAVHQAQATA